jgi:hypothetical protein
MTPKQATHRYLRTGQYDEVFREWPGDDFIQRCRQGKADLHDALVVEVARRTAGTPVPLDLPRFDLPTFTRKKIEPMIRGLFPRSEQETVLDALQRTVVFLTPETIEQVLRGERWMGTAWRLANLYLGSLRLELLGPKAPRILGLSEELTCYVSMEYFAPRNRFDDFVIHEIAHVFHNCKRRTIGLPEGRRKEWLQNIDFSKRETFAYACEVYSRILELGASPAERRALLDEHAAARLHGRNRAARKEMLSILREAVEARNGWKRIFARCAQVWPPKPLHLLRVAISSPPSRRGSHA